MNRDIKLGLALGVLLIGMVGAFFFRNESTPQLEAPRLENPQRLDDRISERPVVPYLNGVDDPPPRGEPAPRRPFGSNVTSGRDAGSVGMFVPDPPDEREIAAPPPPIPAAPRNPPVKPDRGRTEPIAIARGGPADRPAADGSGSADAVHVVRSGDTLSGLAQRYLGSAARFEEIYQANRDQLRSPNDLRLGLKLRIPRRKPAIPRNDGDSTRSVAPARLLAPEPLFPDDPNPARLTSRRPPAGTPTPWAPATRTDAVKRTPPMESRAPAPPREPVDLVPAPSAFDDRPDSGSTPFGNPSGSRSSTALGGAEPAIAPGRYVVLRGDTLERIAVRLLGDRNAVGRILDANREVISSADGVREGMSLRIPER